ncbi:MAG TPA: bifunctional phosphoribosylaminoimidazolecarboxamide formyltransferase/IMP cyclohydrolase [Candidatus Polarisedimenticolaceae bacterium]|nr:bifunctional phosphoribosylaminoimidazolecarboxamide formyltransferase/IMP cyclohydrolase [Candidatus Polarisedimenticolaceae bacterium]
MDRVQRALVSTYRKEGLVPFCRSLAELGIEILSSGGTAALLRAEGIPAVPVSEHTGFPEMLDGRVKTLHPRIHAGILAVRDNPEHVADLARTGIPPIDLVVVNLYPFQETAAREGAGFDDVVEMIDVGGPAMIRAAAKNHAHVGVVVDPEDYAEVADELRAHGLLSPPTLRRLAAKAFRHTADYDGAIAAWLADRVDGIPHPRWPRDLRLTGEKVQDLRYGENPHQTAAFYRVPGEAAGLAGARVLQGKELSFNNILDLDAVLALAADLDGHGCVIVKHGNPCGVALGQSPEEAFRRALACDPTSAFGGVIAFNTPLDAGAAAAIGEAFYEAVAAPEVTAEAQAALARKKNLRVLAVGPLPAYRRTGADLRRVTGGLLAQDWDAGIERVREGKLVTRRGPEPEEWDALQFAWTVAKHVKSNAIVYARADHTVGIGAGQMSRVDSARIGTHKAEEAWKTGRPLEGAVMASDAFFPFRDGIDVAAGAGIRAVVQPGGSVRDEEVIAAADEHGLAMVFTGRRHFRH